MVVEWIQLGFNLQDDHETGFYVVHGILIGVNLVLACVLAVIGVRGWRQGGVLLASRGTMQESGDD